MKYKLLIIVIVLLSPFGVIAQKFHKLDKSVADYVYYPERAAKRGFSKSEKQKAELMPKIRVLYSRPAAKERKVFGGLIKYDEVWRLGANEATEIQFFVDVMVGETKVTAGRYTLYVIPNATDWEFIINRDNDMWGAYSYNMEKDVCRVKVKTEKTKNMVENLSAVFIDDKSDLINLVFAWENTKASLPIKIIK